MSGDFSVGGVLDALYALPSRRGGAGRALMVIGARRGEGVTTIVGALAHAAAAQTTYCIDLDLRRNALARAFSEEGPPLGPKIDGKLGGTNFYTIIDGTGAVIREASPAFSYHRLGRSRAYVGAFDARVAAANSKVLISSAPDYWDAARAGGATVIVDAPALQRSHVALRVAPHMDGVALVVSDGVDSMPSALAARDELIAAGANILGLIYTRASAPVMAMEKLVRKVA